MAAKYTKKQLADMVRSQPNAEAYKGLDDNAIFERVVAARPEVKTWVQEEVVTPPPGMYQQFKDLARQGFERMTAAVQPALEGLGEGTSRAAQAAQAGSKQIVETTFIPPKDGPIQVMTQLGAAARAKGAGYAVEPEAEKALEDFTVFR